MRQTITGWMLDLYPVRDQGLAIWLLEQPPVGSPPTAGRRFCLRQSFPVTFYAAGPDKCLHLLWRYLQTQDDPPVLRREQRRDIFLADPLTVLAAEVTDPAHQPALFNRAAAAFPDLSFYDADIPVSLRYLAAFDVFPLARLQAEIELSEPAQPGAALPECRLASSGACNLLSDKTSTPWPGDPPSAIEANLLYPHVLDSRWDLDPEPAPLRVMRLSPDCDPYHQEPALVDIQVERRSYRFSLHPARPLLINLSALLQRYDPDLLLTAYGDTWLLPHLLEQSERLGLPLPLNRDPRLTPLHKDERSYQAYGQVIHRGRQVHLYGRWHIDIHNAMMYHDYALDGVLESARVTGLPVQQAARLSPGTGISSMQIVTALRQGVLTPWHKQQAEVPKNALELIKADQGGLVYQPEPGLHYNVAEIDFISMYPGIMARFNISPETIACGNTPSGEALPAAHAHVARVPELELWVDPDIPGLVPQTLQPLLEKRIALKLRSACLPAWDPRKKLDKARAAAHKWLLVTCFGYLGYKNARFGRIEAHQAVTACSRECLLRAKEAAEDAGYKVLHLYVDGMWVHKPGCASPGQIQPLLEEIVRRTRLPVGLEGIYRWVVFSTSKIDAHLSVANRYFGAYQDGSLKLRGIEARRGDTAPFIAAVQTGILDLLAPAGSRAGLAERLPLALDYIRQELCRLRRGEVPMEALLVRLRLSRELSEYRSPSPAARAAVQLVIAGKPVRPGMRVRLLYLRGGRVHAWDCPPPPDPREIDLDRYTELLLRACAAVLAPFGLPLEALPMRLHTGAQRLPLPKMEIESAVAVYPWIC